ncbi:transmembrane protein 131-like [Nematolebias whitei]|uniref:transmembrane protein 131-like n=1 Tax=Nematolebias whitei TaxID=451745 RepID=UPI00189A606C|nr:transmembrane protein 131-like [Nematolebias whitei]
MAGLHDFHQGSHCHRKTWINILLGVLQILLPIIHHGGAQLQALSQMSTSVVEVWQPEEADPFVPLQVEKEQRKDGLPLEDSSSPFTQDDGKLLHIQPPVLDFGTQPLGLPGAETIYIHNPSQEVPVTLLSMFTSSRHFYVPSFHRRVIPPKGKASFKLIFLPSEEGSVENTLFINTSAHGLISYQVFGVGRHQASLKSHRKDGLLIFPHIQSIKLTQTQEDASNITILGLLLECSFSKSLQSNPQGSCLQNEERLSLQINLSARGDQPADLDKLKPYIIEHILFVLIAPNVGPASHADAKIEVYMLNSGGKKLYVKDMQVLSKVEASLNFNQVLLKPESKNFTQVATLACKSSLPDHGQKCTSHITLKIMENRTAYSFPGLHIKHRWTVGDLFSLFQVRQNNTNQVDLWFSNPFPLPLTVRNASLSEKLQAVVKVMNFSSPLMVRQGCWRILSLQLLNKALPMNQMLTLSLDTSLGASLHIPLYFHPSPLSSEVDVVFEAQQECGHHCPLRLSVAGHLEWQRSLLPDSFTSSWAVDSKLAAELCSRWQTTKDKVSCRWPRLPAEASSTLDFGATPVNESKVKTFMLKNPTSSVVSVEIRILSLYPSPLEALDLLTKWFNISSFSVNISTTEFSLLASPHKAGENVAASGEGVLHLLLQPWESREVAVAFTPSAHKPVTTILIIRNNLTVFDMMTVQGYGAKELLRVGGKLPGPGTSLRFNVPQSTLMECRDGLRTSKPLFAIRKSFKVENAGELPLTVMSMNINGYKCQGFGFEVLQCRSFSIERNTSSEITIAFTPDFTSSWVIRDLTLVTSRGTAFPFTLNVTLPHHMLPLCAQVVPGPSWEETFWIFTLIFTCFSLVGVCLMAFHQAQYILTEFSSPSIRSNHNPVLSQDNSAVNNITPNGMNKIKGSCKTYMDTCHTSDKKGRGSSSLASPAPRSQSSKKGSSTTPSQQQQKKRKVSLYYTKYKPSSSPAAAVDEEQDDVTPESPVTPDPCISNQTAYLTELNKNTSTDCKEDLQGTVEDGMSAAAMFPMETHAGFPGDITLGPGPRPGLLICSPVERSCSVLHSDKTNSEKRDSSELEVQYGEDVKTQKKKALNTEGGTATENNKGKRSRRKAENVLSAPEQKVPEREKEPDWKTGGRNINGNRSRSHCCNGFKADVLKPVQNVENPLKQNGVCPARSRRKVTSDRRAGGVCESSSDSGSSSGSVRASRGSWGSWSSASSMEGDKEHSARTHTGSTSSRKRDSMQFTVYPSERDCYQTMNNNYKVSSTNSVYNEEMCQSSDPTPSSFVPSFADVAAGMDRNMDPTCQYVSEDTWSAPSIPLTNEFRYNTTEALPYIPQPAASGSYNGFPWSSANSHCNSPCCYVGNGQFLSAFPKKEGHMGHVSQRSWTEEQPQESPTTWNTASCVGSKPYFSGTRSLSPMSSLFGSIWTPQSHFPPERSAPVSPMSPITPMTPPHSPFNRESEGTYRPIQYSNFNPFGPHMNLDIWNSSSNRSSNSQLSNDSGYCGDV